MMNLVLAPFIAALFAPLLVRLFKAFAHWLLALVPLGIFYQIFAHKDAIGEGQRVLSSYPWFESFDVNLSFMLDGLSFTFALLISGIGTLIIIYAGGYLKGHPQLGRFLSFLLAFMGAMLGVVLADNLITLFIFWELTSLTSFFLIGFKHEKMASRRGAIQALVITGLGGLLMLVGFVLVGTIGGTYELSELLSKGDFLKENPLYGLVFFFIAAGAFTKSAQFPFHSWLPNAMEAPTPVSAYLHSATMVKAGVYLLMRFFPILGGTDIWMMTLTTVGALTLVGGALLAAAQDDLKLVLAYTTVASLGLLVMGLGTNNTHVIEGAVLYLIAHAFFKGALFMVIGVVDHEAGTRSLSKLGGLRRAMPVTAIAAFLAAFSMMGLPLFVGFLAKETLYAGLYEGAAHGDLFFWGATGAGILGNALMFGAASIFAIKPFWGRWIDPPKPAHEGGLSLILGPVTLALMGLVGLIALGVFTHDFVSPMASSILGKASHIDLHWYHGVNPALIMSLITIALGCFFYLIWGRLARFVNKLLDAIGWGPDQGFDQFMKLAVGTAVGFNRFTQTGQLETYVRLTFIAVAAVIFGGLYYADAFPSLPQMPTYRFYQWGIMALAIIGIWQVVQAKTRLTAIVSLGVQGFAIALIFILLGAPDLSFTQFMVETLSVVILALVLTRLHLEQQDRRSTKDMFIDLTIAISCGVALSSLLLAVLGGNLDLSLSEFFTNYSKTIAHGHNIVNVILVDFRALDTLGEITVVLVAGLAVMGLIRVRPSEALKRADDAGLPQAEAEPLIDEPEEDDEYKIKGQASIVGLKTASEAG